MTKHLKPALLSFIAGLAIASAVYTGFWFYVAHVMRGHIDTIWNSQDSLGITLQAEKPVVSGFPMPPKVVFSGSLTDRNGITYQSSNFILQGFIVPTQTVTLSAPAGLNVAGGLFQKALSLDNFYLRVKLPRHIPARFDKNHLSAWQKQKGRFPVENLLVVHGALSISGNGYLALDKELKVEGVISTNITGADDLLQELTERKILGSQQALLGRSLLNLISTPDETGASVVKTEMRIQKNNVYMGPLRVAKIPDWEWDQD